MLAGRSPAAVERMLYCRYALNSCACVRACIYASAAVTHEGSGSIRCLSLTSFESHQENNSIAKLRSVLMHDPLPPPPTEGSRALDLTPVAALSCENFRLNPDATKHEWKRDTYSTLRLNRSLFKLGSWFSVSEDSYAQNFLLGVQFKIMSILFCLFRLTLKKKRVILMFD